MRDLRDVGFEDVDRTGRPKDAKLNSLPCQEPRQRHHERGHTDERKPGALEGADERPRHEGCQNGEPPGRSVIDDQHAEQRRAQAAHRADREIDLTQQENHHDPDRHRTGGGNLDDEIRDVPR